MNYDDFFVSGILFDDNDYLKQVSVYVSSKVNKDESLYFFTQQFGKLSNEFSIHRNEKIVEKFNKYFKKYKLKDYEIHDLLEHIINTFNKCYGGIGKLDEIKNDYIENIKLLDFNLLNSSKRIFGNIHKFSFVNNEDNFHLSYDIALEQFELFMIETKFKDSELTFFLNDNIYNDFLNESYDKIKSMNKYRFSFLLDKKINCKG